MYIVDTSFFIQANQADYPLNKATTFWRHVQQLATEGTIISLDKVQKTLENHDKELQNWCRHNLPQEFFRTSLQVLSSYEKIVEWAISQQDYYLPIAVREFLAVHEPEAWLAAYSLQYGCTIVTYERDEPEKRYCITIPEVCGAFDIPCLDTVGLLEQLGLII